VSGVLKHIPNILTALRLAAAPAFAALLMAGDDRAALGIFAFAGLSDAADGFLAKRFGLSTRFGRFLDPAADKLLMLAAFLTLAALGISPWWLTVLVIARDLAIVLAVFVAYVLALPLRVQPLFIGKVNTVVQVSYVGLLLVFLVFGIDAPQFSAWAALVTAMFTIISWFAYGGLWLGALFARNRIA
jgi:cardiolipin synthase